MATAPASWSGEGSSPSRMAAKTTAAAGCSVNSSDVATMGRRGSETVMRSQPSTCELRASATSHACDSSPGTRSRSPEASPKGRMSTVVARVASKSGPATRRCSPAPWRRVSRKPE